MGVNSTDVFYDQSESILCGIKSEHVWGVLPHRARRIGISGSDGRGGASWKYQEASERRKKAILSQFYKYCTCFVDTCCSTHSPHVVSLGPWTPPPLCRLIRTP
jgi:hypothetical protein